MNDRQSVRSARGLVHPLRITQVMLFGIAGLLLAPMAWAADVQAHDAWVALTPPGAYATAGFMTLHNGGETDVDLLAAAADGFEAVELHRSVNKDGMHRMIEQERIAIPAGEAVQLAPGGYHIMLIGLQRPLVEGDSVPIELTFDDGNTLMVEAPVKRRGHAMGGTHSEH